MHRTLNKRFNKKSSLFLEEAILLKRNSTLTIFTSKVIDVASTFRNEDNEYMPRTSIDLDDQSICDTFVSLKITMERENV